MPDEAQFAIANIHHDVIATNFICSNMPFDINDKMRMLEADNSLEAPVPTRTAPRATQRHGAMLGFNDQQVALMIATYIALDSFGTATNVTGDGAIAIIVDRMVGGFVNDEGDPDNVRELSFDGMAYLHAVSVEGVVSPEELEASAAATRSGE